MTPKKSDPFNAELQEIGSAVALDLAKAIPENDFYGFAAYTMIVPEVLEHLSRYSVPEPSQLGTAWSYIDAACQGINGLSQLFDDKTHRPLATKAKGILNLASSVQAITLTTLSAPALGPIGFAAAFGVGFVISLDEAVRQMRRRWNKEYFVMDSLAELEQTCILIQKKQQEVTALEQTPHSDPRQAWALKLKRDNLNALKKQQDELKNSITAKLDVDLYESNKTELTSTLKSIIDQYPVKNTLHSEFRSFLSDLKGRTIPHDEQYHHAQKRVRQDSEACKTACTQSVSNSLLYGMAFAGAILLCIPGMQPAALALISIASVLFLGKNIHKVAQAYHRTKQFFNNLSRETLMSADKPKPQEKVQDEKPLEIADLPEDKAPITPPPSPKGC